MRIAVDFDGTIVENQYPAIGCEIAFAVPVLKKLIAEGNEVILWTSRSGTFLKDAVDWCSANGLTFYAVNSNHRNCCNPHQFHGPRKIRADIYVDDKNLGGIPNWPKIYVKIHKLKHRLARDARRRRRQLEGSRFSKLWFYISLKLHPVPSYINIPHKNNKRPNN